MEKEQLFGIKATDYTPNLHVLSLLKQIFTLQSIKFWIVTYIISFIFYYFFKTNIIFIDIFNIILFPFSVILLGTIAISFRGQLYRLLYPSIRTIYVNQHFLIAIMIGILKLILYIAVWKYTFILGIVGFIIRINEAIKLLK